MTYFSFPGLLVTAKKRQEFRIKLQKRARRRAEKRIEHMEEDKQWRDVSREVMDTTQNPGYDPVF